MFTTLVQQYGDTIYKIVALTIVLSPVLVGALAVSASLALLRYAFGKR